jgi:hypothetical protein
MQDQTIVLNIMNDACGSKVAVEQPRMDFTA